MKKLNISVLGCGWLGLPLLKSLVSDGHHVKGSSRNEKTLSDIRDAGAEAFAIDLPQSVPQGFMERCEVLIITLPPGGRKLGPDAESIYLQRLESLSPWLSSPHGPAIIYTSSTGVYGEQTGVVAESALTKPETFSAQAVCRAEEWLAGTGCPLIVLRLAGLVASDRHPGRFYGGRNRKIPQADSPVNLVHRKDVISAVKLCLSNNEKFPVVYNVCSGSHPAKGDFYTAAAELLGLEVAGSTPGGAEGKIVDSSKLRARGWEPGWDDLDIKALSLS
ncbi:hypothetical protein FUA23_13640 [Neolewinella aurantiaca]|uniref:Pyrroline-5-carboxylate reductase catalytic N-terminal domain-containing protein n=1 Tax=Neolewinella aurantiaca TaxID=2602767 RepID=A0A5C7FDB2_9BACT|nr:NAD(P)-binding domain-containing protein [Neolewinella aurantiaca]TXF88704.1 hypothetical protein FUA23_13640 [Neolewinella aurantiaca]